VDEAQRAAARAAYLAAVEAGAVFIDFSDFSLFILSVQRVRWVGGYGRMDSATAEAYAAAAPDPVMSHAAGAVAHLNADHADALLDIARTLGGYPDATRGGPPPPLRPGPPRRPATVELTQRARAALGAPLSAH
jgi:putative heme iron utilization protein